tara:strand:+ start:19640 stop:22951 length:3312 start_codon:yes stop_codon:yes gene_type:complete
MKLNITKTIHEKCMIQGFNASPNLLYIGAGTITPMNEYLGYGYKTFIFDIKNDYCEMYYSIEQGKDACDHFLKDLNKDKGFLQKLIKHYTLSFNKALKQSPKNLSSLSTQQLLKAYHTFNSLYFSAMGITHLIEAFSLSKDEEIKKKLESYTQKAEEITLLMSPVKESWVNEQEHALMQIGKKAKQGSNVKKLLEKHAEEFHWILNSYAGSKKLDASYFEKEMQKIMNGDITINYQQIIKDKKVLSKKLGLSEEVNFLLHLTEEIIAWQDLRKKHILMSDYFIDQFLEEIGKRVNISLKDMRYLFPHEIHLDQLKNLNVNELKKRKKGVILVTNDDEHAIYTGNEYLRVQKILKGKETSKVKEFNGNTASSGYATGIVRICKSLDAINNFKQGEILVASMTRPEYVPAMKKAAAIVTDEGGVTCHAAIVSRELGIPCVIGTNIATQMLKDGDFVEVKADHAQIKIVDKGSGEKVEYTPRITVLHVEDDPKIIKSLSEQFLNKQMYVHNADNFEDALEVIKKCDIDFLVCDGMFPNKKGEEEQKNFIPLMKEIDKIGKDIDIIAWSNSTHVHEYCKENNVENFSKYLLTKHRWKIRGREYIKVDVKTAHEMVDIVYKKWLEKINIPKLIKGRKVEHYYTEPGTIIAMYMAMDVRTALFEQTAGVNYGLCITEMNNGEATLLFDPSNDGKISNAIFTKIKDEDFFPVMYDTIMDRSKKLIDFSRNLKKMSYVGKSHDELKELYLKFVEILMQMRMWSSLPTAMEHASNILTKTLKKIIDTKIQNPVERNKVFSMLTTPQEDSYVMLYNLEIAQLALEQEKGNDITKGISNVVEKYAWINYTFMGDALTQKDVKKLILEKSIEDHKKLIKDYNTSKKQVPLDRERLFSKYKFNKEEKRLFDIGAGIVFLKFYRKGIFAESYYNSEFLLSEIGKKIGLTMEEVRTMLAYEVLAALALGSFPKELLHKRMEKSVIMQFNGQSIPLSPDVKKMYNDKIIGIDKDQELKGQTAYPGKVKGMVRMVNELKDMEQFKKGDILVSRSTNPTLVPAMEKAAAIVTDLGGLTCHAAIVARELKKPCIVGISNATVALKDGDQVEVDADKGIVKKI